jgi:hypothetical protein
VASRSASDFGLTTVKKLIQRQMVFAEMEVLMPWQSQNAMINLHFPKASQSCRFPYP